VAVLSLEYEQQKRIRLAWAVLLIAFALACVLLSGAGYMAWDFRSRATVARDGVLILRASPELVKWQRKGHTVFVQARDQQRLEEGGRISIALSAGYGQASTVRLFDHSTIDMWPGADLMLEQLRTSQWNAREQVVVVRQYSGYVRYDLRNDQPFARVTFRVLAGDEQARQTSIIDLQPGGSYSVEIRPSDRRILVANAARSPYKPMLVDVAVRSGQALVRRTGQEAALTEGQRLEVDPAGMLSAPMPAVWDLVRDNNFSQYSEEEYNNTTIIEQPMLPRSRSWQVFSGPEHAGGSGFFRISHGCRPPQKDSDCPPDERQQAAWFIRTGEQTTSFTTGVVQQLGHNRQGVDVSEYRSLVFSAWVRVLHQSLEGTGELGTECPVMVRFLAKEKNPTDPEMERVICVYTSDDPSQEPERAPGIVYYRVEPYQWYRLIIELRNPEWLPYARYIRSIELYANGHDYDSRATGVSLIGSHAAPFTLGQGGQ
jgi:hypothetical protein